VFPGARLRYAVRALMVLSESYPGEVMSLRAIADREQISEKYLEPVFAQLRGHGIVCSVRGKGGGYYLRHPPEQLTLRTITAALGNLPGGTRPTAVHRHFDDVIWDELLGLVERHLESLTLGAVRVRCDAGREVENYQI